MSDVHPDPFLINKYFVLRTPNTVSKAHIIKASHIAPLYWVKVWAPGKPFAWRLKSISELQERLLYDTEDDCDARLKEINERG